MQYTIIKAYPLREKMDKKGLTIRQLAKVTGVHYTYISRLLVGKSIASEEVKNKLASCL